MIEVKDIKKSYSRRTVLNGVNLVVNEGEIHTVVGKNGSGKTTLIKIIADLIESDYGRVLIDGCDIKKLNSEYRSKMGYVFDEPIFIESFSVKEFLSFSLFMHNLNIKENFYRIDDLCSLFELPKESKLDTLSKGQKMKVSFSCSLLHSPYNLILDEPFSGVDSISIKKIILVLKKLKENGVSILLSSHRVEIISEISDYVSILNHGIIDVKFDSDYKLKFDDGIYVKPQNKILNSLSKEIDFGIPSWIYER